MRRFMPVLFLFALALLLPAQVRSADEFKLEEGFKLIFNGKDLDGWKEFTGKDKAALDGKTEAFKGRFKVKEGVLIIDPSVKGDSHIETKKEFGKDVHIKFDFKPGPKCNNDFFIRGIKFDIVPGNKENKDVKEGQWYTCEIIAKGDTVEHKINGEMARKTTMKAKAAPFIMRAEIGEIHVKNIRVKE